MGRMRAAGRDLGTPGFDKNQSTNFERLNLFCMTTLRMCVFFKILCKSCLVGTVLQYMQNIFFLEFNSNNFLFNLSAWINEFKQIILNEMQRQLV